MPDFENPFIIVKAQEMRVKCQEESQFGKREGKEKKNHWSEKENLQYISFFKQNMDLANNPQWRK